ncbi:kinase and ubiquitin-associated domains of Mark3PAR-1 [Powellomyces hirtus]|nr:kinase and ubiquitin-associated domains of Mark3PAR-1 [Powellomyces hirtus]
MDEYRIVRTIGEGSFGKVKLAVHLVTGEQVAIKQSTTASTSAASPTDRILREILVLAHLSHPNISRLLQVVSTGDQIYLVLEYEPRGDVFDHVQNHPEGRLPEQEARTLFRDLWSAVQYCHASGVVHRDLKPENLLLSESNTLKLIDYGFASLLQPVSDGGGGQQSLSTFCGSPAYAAPEMLSGKKYTGPEADVWSMGVILFVLVTGTMPFDDTHMRKLWAAVIGGKYKIPDFVSAECKDLIQKLLKTNPSARATLVEIRDHAWTTGQGTLAPLRVYTCSSSAGGSVEPYEVERVDAGVLGELAGLGYDTSAVEQAVEGREPSGLTAAYYLVRNRRRLRHDPTTSVL